MDDVGADGDVTVTGISSRAAAASNTGRLKRRALACEPLRDGAAEAESARHSVVDGGVQQAAGFLGHAESSGPEGFVDFFRRRSRQRDLEIDESTTAPFTARPET
jgi:hypothetical protein